VLVPAVSFPELVLAVHILGVIVGFGATFAARWSPSALRPRRAGTRTFVAHPLQRRSKTQQF
jgi:hypothetical protein